MEQTNLIEFFSIIYLGPDEITPEKQIGTIKVDDHLNVHYLYNVDKVDITRSSIKYGDEILLKGPVSAPILGGVTVLDVDLFCGTYKDTVHFDYLSDFVENDPLKRIITSKDGTGEICVLYTLFKNATAANVEVELTCADSTYNAAYGVVAARSTSIERPDYKSLLFLNKPVQGIKLRPGDRIPLSRSLVAVPLKSRLSVDIHLRDDDVIIMGTRTFIPHSGPNPSEQILRNEKCQIKVKVHWKSAALTDKEKDVRAENKLKFVLSWIKETTEKPNLSVYPF